MRKYFRCEIVSGPEVSPIGSHLNTSFLELEALSEDDAVETLERDGLRALVVREINGPVF